MERPAPARPAGPGGDVLSALLRTVRLGGALQFCLMPEGDWETDDKPRMAALATRAVAAIPFHILVEGECWLRMQGGEWALEAGDVAAFPFATGHQLGAGRGGRRISPTDDLPPKPWNQLPVLRYGGDGRRVRLLCGYLECDAVNFRPLRQSLPTLLHVRTATSEQTRWLAATIRQMELETDHPRPGGQSVIERLTEIIFIELLRHQIIAGPPEKVGWLAAAGDPALGRCLALIHDQPRREWSVATLAAEAGLSRSTLTDRFEAVLATSPMRYVREWRLYLASTDLRTTAKPIPVIAEEAGYGTEAAFSRAFSRAFHCPPAAWRHDPRDRTVRSNGVTVPPANV
ncbi:AraC family transcriptional regulator [Microbaculum marinum]|uniref:AraC family transcriptional regulator n=1 Tax=Microbaculum marinum TaxID=1764581 RepID=UPI00361BBAAE